MLKLKYIELGESQLQSQSENLISRRSDEINEYLDKHHILHNSKLVYQDLSTQILRVDEEELAESDIKTLLYVRYLERTPQIEQIINERSIKLSGSNQKYLSKFIKYEMIEDDNLPLVVQHIESKRTKVPFEDIFQNNISIDSIMRVIKRLIKIVVYLHKQGIQSLDLSQSNFEMDVQSYKPTMIAVPLCVKNDISQEEACFRDFEELGKMMVKLISSSHISYASDLSFQQMRLKVCVEQICKEFSDCRKTTNGIQEFIVKQMNRLTCIKQINKSISQSIEQINVQSFIPQTKSQCQFNLQIESLEKDILGSVPNEFKNRQSFEKQQTQKEKCMWRIFCLLICSIFFLMAYVFWKGSFSPFQCIKKETELHCVVNSEREGFLFQYYRPDISISSLIVDFAGAKISAENIIKVLKKVNYEDMDKIKIQAQSTDITLSGLKKLLQYLSNKNNSHFDKTYKRQLNQIDLNILNTPIDNEYQEAYKIYPQSAYNLVEDLFQSFFQLANGIPIFTFQSEITSYLNACLYLNKVIADDGSGSADIRGIFLENKELKDNEVLLIFQKLFNKDINQQFGNISINLSHNQIDGSSLIQIMEMYVNKINKFEEVSFVFDCNPIKKDNYEKLIQLFQQNVFLKRIRLELDLNSFLKVNEFVQLTYFKMKENSSLLDFRINIVDSQLKQVYKLSKKLTEELIPFNASMQLFETDQLHQFLVEFPQREQFCLSDPPQSILNSNLKIHRIEIQSIFQKQEQSKQPNTQLCNLSEKQDIGMQLDNLEVTINELYIQTSVSVAAPLYPNQYSVAASYYEYQSISPQNYYSFLPLKQMSAFQFKKYKFSIATLNDEGAKNIVDQVVNNQIIEELELKLQYNIISKSTQTQLFTIFTQHTSLKQASLVLTSKHLIIFEDSPIINSEESVLDLVSEFLQKTVYLQTLYLSDEEATFSSFKNVLNSFEISPTITNLTLNFKSTNITEDDIKAFEDKKSTLLKKGKQLHLSPLMRAFENPK